MIKVFQQKQKVAFISDFNLLFSLQKIITFKLFFLCTFVYTIKIERE